MKAVWNNTVIAESDATVIVEGNHYFPLASVNQRYCQPSAKTSSCFWKGSASYFTLEVDGEQNIDAAFYYAEPKAKAENIKGYVAFWRGVVVS
ncbi:MAG: hypothetical protein ACI80S_001127 [Pseudohongiellaceae bacterium]|jgi:uncharacterized protein (DUF427 family)